MDNNYKLIKRIIENTHEGIVITNDKDEIVYTNNTAIRINRLSKKQFLGKNILKDFHDKTISFIKPYYHEAKRNLEPVIIKSLPILVNNNKEKIFSGQFTPIIRKNVFKGMLCTVKDITDYIELEKQKAIAHNYLDIAAVLIVILDKKGKVRLINKKGREILEYKRSEIIGKNWFDNFIPKKISRTLKAKFKKFVNDEWKFPEVFEYPVLTKSAQERIISWQNSSIKDENVNLIAILSSGEDITDRKIMEQKLIEDEKRFRMLAENATDIVFRFRTKPELHCEYISPSVTKITGYFPQDYYDDPELVLKIINQEDLKLLQELLKSKKGFRKPIEIRWINKNGEIIWTEQNITPSYDKRGRLTAIDGIARDITERKKAEDKIKYLSFHDSLTDLYNRAYFEEELRRLDTRRQLPLSFVMGDVNSLKLVNDTFGHMEGDSLLKNVANLMKSFCRKEDIIARWGGDEFAILLPQTPKDYAEEIIERIKTVCKKTSKYKIPISISLGFCSKEWHEQDINSIISEAEDNMYRSKLLEKKSISNSIISSITRTLFEKDFETEDHTIRIRELALEIGKILKLSKSELDNLSLLATLHDIGKIAISDELLNKKARLTKREWEIVKRHPEIGFNICESSPQLAHIADFVLTHHECFDGSGYPQGIKGKNIPIESRILAIIDAYDVMIHEQPYKEALDRSEAVEELKKSAGTQFDPTLVEKFIEVLEKELVTSHNNPIST